MKEKLINLLSTAGWNLFVDGIASKEQIADHLIRNGVTIHEWIRVTERLPEGEELVMILCKNGAMFVGYCGKQYYDYERRWSIKTALNSTKLLNLGRVTHWMPLPELPEK